MLTRMGGKYVRPKFVKSSCGDVKAYRASTFYRGRFFRYAVRSIFSRIEACVLNLLLRGGKLNDPLGYRFKTQNALLFYLALVLANRSA